MVGNATDKVDVTVTRIILSNFCTSLTKEECGRVVREAFPGVARRRSNSKWYYFGLRHIEGNTASSMPLASKKESSEEDCENANHGLCIGDLHQPCASVSASVHSNTAQTKQQSHVNLKPFSIPSLNLCKEDMSDLAQGQLIGEGTFGQCIAGTYKGVPAAFKMFKDLECLEDAHREAKILLKIPSHPGIPMLIGIHTVTTPFVLATKLCKTAGKPETYSHFLKNLEHSVLNLGVVLQLLVSVGEALTHLFAVGILHNDVKGNNVVLEDTNGLKRGVLIDFGKACSVENARGMFDIFLLYSVRNNQRYLQTWGPAPNSIPIHF